MSIKADEKTKVFIDNELKYINANKDKITEEKRYIRAEMLKIFRIDCITRSDTEKERLIEGTIIEKYKVIIS